MTIFQRIIPILTLLLSALVVEGREIADIPNVQLADSTRFVSDPDGILQPSTIERLDEHLLALRRATTAEMAVVLVENFPENTDIDTYATDLFEAWGVGKNDNDNGVLLVVSRGDRKAAIRTGYGMEGVLTDAQSGRILRNKMFPAFRQGDYDGGVEAAVNAIFDVVTNPDHAAELKSEQKGHGNGEEAVWGMALKLLGLLALGWIGYCIWVIATSRKLPTVVRYEKLTAAALPAAVVTCFTLGMALPGLLLLVWMRYRVRNRKRVCENCGTKMHKLDEATDNLYLTPAQDTEERINSVDYDVWLCDNCHQTDILPYRNRMATYTECPYCGARASKLISDRIVTQPTSIRTGRGEKMYVCQNCGKGHAKPYEIAKLPVVPVIIGNPGGGGFGGGGFGGGSFGGGSFGGGSFGGGSTGGGGASGGW